MGSNNVSENFLFTRLYSLRKAEVVLQRKYASLAHGSAADLAAFAAALARLDDNASIVEQYLDAITTVTPALIKPLQVDGSHTSAPPVHKV